MSGPRDDDQRDGRHADGGTSTSSTSGNDDNGGQHRWPRKGQREHGFPAGSRAERPHHPDGWQQGGR